MKREMRLLLLLPGLAAGCGQTKEPGPPPSPRIAAAEAEVRALKDIGLEVYKSGGTCFARFADTTQKKTEVTVNHDGVFWLLTNVDCDQDVEFRIRAMAQDGDNKPLPKYCEQTVQIPGELEKPDALLLSCTFPRKNKDKYKGVFLYKLQVCAGSNCTEPQDPELNVKR